MAKSPTSKFEGARSFQCSVPATVYPRGDYEYAVALFGNFENDHRANSGTGYGRVTTTTYNILIESKYPIHFQPKTFTFPTYGDEITANLLCLYDELHSPYANHPHHIKALFDTKYEYYSSPSSGVTEYGKWGLFGELTGEDDVRLVDRNKYLFGKNGSKNIKCTTTITATSDVEVTDLYFHYQPGYSSYDPSSINLGKVFASVYFTGAREYPDGTTYITIYPVITNGQWRETNSDAFTGRYSIGNINNPTYSSYAEWQAACEALASGS